MLCRNGDQPASGAVRKCALRPPRILWSKVRYRQPARRIFSEEKPDCLAVGRPADAASRKPVSVAGRCVPGCWDYRSHLCRVRVVPLSPTSERRLEQPLAIGRPEVLFFRPDAAHPMKKTSAPRRRVSRDRAGKSPNCALPCCPCYEDSPSTRRNDRRERTGGLPAIGSCRKPSSATA